MSTPITFRLAKLLQEKKFDAECVKYYWHLSNDYPPQVKSGYISKIGATVLKLDYNFNAEKSLEIKKGIDFHEAIICSAPTPCEVRDWLYTKHNIWISVDLIDNSREYYFKFKVSDSNNREYFDEDCWDQAKVYHSDVKHGSYPEAFEAAIDYVLINCI